MSEEVFNFEIVEENIIIPAGVVEIGPDGLSAYQVAVSRGMSGQSKSGCYRSLAKQRICWRMMS
jgi:hypothetical protein